MQTFFVSEHVLLGIWTARDSQEPTSLDVFLEALSTSGF